MRDRLVMPVDARLHQGRLALGVRQVRLRGWVDLEAGGGGGDLGYK